MSVNVQMCKFEDVRMCKFEDVRMKEHELFSVQTQCLLCETLCNCILYNQTINDQVPKCIRQTITILTKKIFPERN